MNSETLFRKKGRDGMRFQSKKRSKEGVTGFVLSLIAAVGFMILCIVSAVAKGEAGEFVGAIGLGIMFLCVGSFSLSLKGLKERDVFTRLPFAGLLISGALFVVLFCLYILGIRF